MEVKLYNFSKRNRETLRVTGNGITVQCTLKEGTSITDPVLLFQTQVASTYNYVYIPYFGRYYFVAGSKAVENMWEISCTEDYLATFKAEIGLTQCNILYATGSTRNLVDDRIPVKAEVLRGHTYNAIDGMTIVDSGMIVLGITGKGSFGPYLLQYSDDISEILDGIDNWSSFITDNWTFTKQLFFGGSASECLRSAIMIPILFGGSDVSAGSAIQLSLGNYPCTRSDNSAINGYKITKPVINKVGTISIPWQSTDWKKVSAYTDITLYLPFVGLVSIPATEAQNETSFEVHYAINVTSGDISVEVRGAQTSRKYLTASGNCALPTAYGSTGIDTNKLTSAVVAGAGVAVAAKAASIAAGPISYAAEVAIGAGLANVASKTMEAMGGNGFGSGGLGGGANTGMDRVMHCFVTQKVLSDTQAHLDPIIGKPYMAVGTPSQFSGYVQTDGFQLASTKAYSSEKDMVNKLMDSGIYYT